MRSRPPRRRRFLAPSTGYLRGTTFRVHSSHDDHDLDRHRRRALIADTEAEILRLVDDSDPSTAGVYEMVRYHLGLDGVGLLAASACGRSSACSPTRSITGDHRRALPGAAAVELGHNFSLVHDDIEDGDRERRHRPTLWAVHGIPQAINTGDTLFSLSRGSRSTA